MLTNCLAACTHLSSTVSQLFEPQVPKIAVFTYRSPQIEIGRDIGRKSSIFNMRKSKNRYFYHIFVSPGDAPGAITLNVVRMETEFDAYKLSHSMQPSIFNSLPVIRTTNAKNCRFHVPQPTFLFPLETPLRLSRNMLHGRKDNSKLAKPRTACTYLSSIVSKLYNA